MKLFINKYNQFDKFGNKLVNTSWVWKNEEIVKFQEEISFLYCAILNVSVF